MASLPIEVQQGLQKLVLREGFEACICSLATKPWFTAMLQQLEVVQPSEQLLSTNVGNSPAVLTLKAPANSAPVRCASQSPHTRFLIVKLAMTMLMCYHVTAIVCKYHALV